MGIHPRPYQRYGRGTLPFLIDSYDDAKIALTTIGYYRLKGYSFQLVDSTTQKFREGTCLSDILKLYQFDSELRRLLFSYLSLIEVALRSHIVNSFQLTRENPHDVLIWNDPSEFKNKSMFWKNQGTIAREICRSKDAFIQHNFQKYDGAIPIWAVVEVVSFGTVSKIVKNMKTGNDTAFSELRKSYKFRGRNGNYIYPSQDMLTSWIYAASILRNICAHNGRIYNRVFSIRPKLIEADAISPVPQFYGLYQILLSMKYLRPTDDSWNIFCADLLNLLNKYSDVCDLRRLNFPSDWESHIIL